MAQNFVYGPVTAVHTLRALVSNEDFKITWKEAIFGRHFFKNFVKKMSKAVDVFYVHPLNGNISLSSPSIPGDFKDLERFSQSGVPVYVGGLEVYAIDSTRNVRGWSRKTWSGEKDSDLRCTDFARDAAELYGKAVLIDTPSTNSQNGLVSIYFPYSIKGFIYEAISRGEDPSAFNTDLNSALERILDLSK
jgi:hypothetical protein